MTSTDGTTDDRFPSTYARSLASLLADLLRQGGGSRVVDREQVRQRWRARYPEAASTSITRTGRRSSAVGDTAGSRAKSSLNRAYRDLERAGAISRHEDGTAQVVDVQVLVECARQYVASNPAPAGGEARVPASSPEPDVDQA